MTMKWLITKRTPAAAGTVLHGQEHDEAQFGRRTVWAWLWLLCLLATVPVRADTAPSMTHIHGLAFSIDGKRLMVSSHDGLTAYLDVAGPGRQRLRMTTRGLPPRTTAFTAAGIRRRAPERPIPWA
jgi:hypothetical protein